MFHDFVKVFMVLFLLNTTAYSQTTGSFEIDIPFNGSNHTVSYYVPTDYDESIDYPLFIALHGCFDNSTNFRNSLIEFSSSIDAIILCPDFKGDQISGMNGQLIIDAINETINMEYSIDTNLVYMTGYSCNGQETYKHGWDEIYPFAGIIPLNSAIPTVNNEFNFASSIPTCICIGTEDGSYNNNITLFNTFINSGGTGILNEMPGIGHEWYFSSRDDELLECIDWIKSLESSTLVNENNNIGSNIEIYPNPNNQYFITIKNKLKYPLVIEIYSSTGKIIKRKTSQDLFVRVSLSSQNPGMYYAKISDLDSKTSVTKKIILID